MKRGEGLVGVAAGADGLGSRLPLSGAGAAVRPVQRQPDRHGFVAVISSNDALAEAPGNVRLNKGESGLTRTSVVNVSQIVTLDRKLLTQRVRALPAATLHRIDDGVRLVLGL
jgi:mRNA interferase MazF